MAVAYLSAHSLCDRWGISRASLYRLVKAGYLPRPVKFSARVARWPLAEVEELEARLAADRGAEARS